jgi:hypothetical protein
MSPIEREYFRVPREDRRVYLRPGAADLAALVARNRTLLGGFAFPFAGRPFQEYRAAARAEIAALARRYTERWGFATGRPWAEPAPLVVSGHQPLPFHPGVWFKNFLAGRLAEAVGGAAVNLDVDNDEAHEAAFVCPTRGPGGGGDGDAVRAAAVAYATLAGGVPHEEQPVGALRAEAGDEVLAAAPTPATADAFRAFWMRLVAAVPEAANLGEAFVVARRGLEEMLGLRNLELPVSHVADGEVFRLFVAEMLRRRADLFAAYNDSLAEYRRVYHERSAAQPVPDLACDGPRMELPLWAWRAGERRRRLWVEDAPGGGVRLTADGAQVAALSADEVRRPDAAAARLREARDRGWKVRPRALSMTLFVRLAVADVFIHGLGGALYDKITDAMFERLLGVRPPELILASATVHLPLETFPARPRDLEVARRAVRDWRYNPDRMLAAEALGRPGVRAPADEKRRLVAHRGATRAERRRDFLRVRDLNDRLAAFDADGPERARRRLAEVRRQLRANAILRGREYPYCLYPPEDLAAFYRQAIGLGG